MIPRSLFQRTLRLASSTHTTIRRLTTLTQRQQPPIRTHPRHQIQHHQHRPASTSTPSPSQPPQNTPAGDAAVEELTELYATAYDEFEIASESTEANATYAEEDRNAAREELERVLEAYRKATSADGGEGGGDAGTAEEVRRRVGQRVRELEQGVKAMEERALEHD